MKGLQITIDSAKIFVGINDGATLVNIMLKDGVSHVTVSGINYVEQTYCSWYDTNIKSGGTVSVKFVKIDHITPLQMINKDKTIKPPKTKLEVFKALEANLKKRKLI